MGLLQPRHLFVAVVSVAVLASVNAPAEARKSGPKWSYKDPHPDPQVEMYLAKVDFNKALQGLQAARVASNIRSFTAEMQHMRLHYGRFGSGGLRNYRDYYRQQAVAGAIVGLIQAIAVENFNKAVTRVYTAKARYEAWKNSGKSLRFENQSAARLKPRELFDVGLQLERGDKKQGVPIDVYKAGRWYRRAAEFEISTAQVRLGRLYVRGAGVRQDFKEAAHWFQIAADDGNADGMFEIGVLYSHGHGIEQDHGQAVDYLREAAGLRHLGAQLELGRHYELGLGVDQDAGQAFAWYKKAADKKLVRARFALGRLYESGLGVKRDPKKAAKQYERAAKDDFTPAMIRLGQLYESGANGRQDGRKAFKWYREADELGDPAGTFMLGRCYLKGTGTTPNEREANRSFKKAGRQGLPIARFEVGVSYRDGRGYRKNLREAWAWFDYAAAGGLKQAETARDALGENLDESQLAMARDTRRRLRPRPPTPTVRQLQRGWGSGTAFFVTNDGFLVTNFHVVDGAAEISIETPKGSLTAAVIKVDQKNDLALLKVKGDFKALPVIPSADVREGAEVFTTGFPNPDKQGFTPSSTFGNISKQTGYRDNPNGFQITVPITPGNSGGPLVDELGNVVGVIRAQLLGPRQQNTNFAVKSRLLLMLLKANVPNPDKKLRKRLTGLKISRTERVAAAKLSVVRLSVEVDQ